MTYERQEAAVLPQVRCPQCGAVNDTNAPDYPFCIGCQDNLAKCGHCRWFDRDASLCLSSVAAGLFDVAPDATPPCDQHTPGEAVLVRTRGYLPFATAGVTLALVVLVYALLLLRGPPLPVELKLRVAADQNPVLGVPFAARVEMENVGKRVANGVRLQVNSASLQSFRLLRAAPAASARPAAHGEWLALSYPALQPGEERQIDLYLLPTAVGARNLVITLVSSGNTYHGMVDVPVIVAERRPTEDTG
jgi:hypothetical protein